MRDPKQFDSPDNGGFSQSNSATPSVFYDAEVDAARIEIPPFHLAEPPISLKQDIGPEDTVIEVVGDTSAAARIAIKIDDEVMVVSAKVRVLDDAGRTIGGMLTVSRGEHGTPAASHRAGALIPRGGNSLANQVVYPLATSDGHNWLLTWDAMWPNGWNYPESGLTNHKTFMISAPNTAGGKMKNLIEVRTRYDGGSKPFNVALSPDVVAAVDMRGYSVPAGPNVLGQDGPVKPMVGTFAIRPFKWVRYYLLIEQHTTDPEWDLVTLWVGDEDTDPVLINDRMQFHAHGKIGDFRLRYNTSTEELKPGRSLLRAWVKNLAVLKGVRYEDVPALMQRPVP